MVVKFRHLLLSYVDTYLYLNVNIIAYGCEIQTLAVVICRHLEFCPPAS
jgi:hypothetical protein